MIVIKRFFYLFYYLRHTDIKQIGAFLKYASHQTGRSGIRLTADAVWSVLKYNVGLKDYFCFRFFELNEKERKKWAGTGFMYEYQLLMNPKGERELLEDKIRFLNHFREYVRRSYCSLAEFQSNPQLAEKMLSNASGRLVLKGSHGQVGAEVEIVKCAEYSSRSLTDHMVKMRYDLIEEYVIQHPSLMELSPSGLNTVRVFTQVHNGQVDILGARLRITINSPVDNMAAGNIAAPVDIDTGKVTDAGVFSDITREQLTIHPVTGIPIVGFTVPFWDDVVKMVKEASLMAAGNKSVGWDVAITGAGPELIEGNHNWCKLLWQLPVKKGLKAELERYL